MSTDEVFDQMRDAIRSEDNEGEEVAVMGDGVAEPDPTTAPKSKAQELKEKVAAKAGTPQTIESSTPAPPRASASYGFHVLGDALPEDPVKLPSARDLLLANMEQCKQAPGQWCVIATYASRKTADGCADRIISGKQPRPTGLFDIEVRSPKVGNEVKHIVAMKFIEEAATS